MIAEILPNNQSLKAAAQRLDEDASGAVCAQEIAAADVQVLEQLIDAHPKKWPARL